MKRVLNYGLEGISSPSLTELFPKCYNLFYFMYILCPVRRADHGDDIVSTI